MIEDTPKSNNSHCDRQRDPETGELEPALWFGRFREYLRMGKGRSLLAAYNGWRRDRDKERKAATGAPMCWISAAQKWRWRERAQSYDLAEDAKEQELWEARRRERKEAEWRTAGKLQDRSEQMLMFPLARTVTQRYEDGREQQVVEPADWRAGDAVKYADAASKLGRLAAGMETERMKGETVTLSLDELLGLPVWALERLAAGEQAEAVLRDVKKAAEDKEDEP